MKKEIFFTDNYSEYADDNTYIGIIEPGITSKEELISSYWKKFKCPHGSYSWDSLDEILSDFRWLDATRVLIVHSDIPKLHNKDLKIYLEILMRNSYYEPGLDREAFYKQYGVKAFEGIIAIFPTKYKGQIESILAIDVTNP